MKIPRTKYTVVSAILVFALLFSAGLSIQARALSLGDVTNTIGDVLGLNGGSSNEAVAQSSQPGSEGVGKFVQTTAVDSIPPVQAVTPETPDTGVIVRQLAVAQTSRTIVPVTYSSSQIGTDIRDELYAISSVIVIVGVALYGMTFLGSARSAQVAQRRPLYIK